MFYWVNSDLKSDGRKPGIMLLLQSVSQSGFRKWILCEALDMSGKRGSAAATKTATAVERTL